MSPRVIDFLFLLWLLKSIAMSLLAELLMCRLGPEWPELYDDSPVIAFIFDSVKDLDPMVMEMGPDLRLATCEHVFIIAPLYAVCAVGIILKNYWLQKVSALLFGPAVAYGMMHYFIIEFFGPLPTTNIPKFVAFNMDFIVVPLLLFARCVNGPPQLKQKIQ